MRKLVILLFVAIVAMALSAAAEPTTKVNMKLSGPGAVNDSTIKAGQPVSIDVYLSTKSELKAVSMGFRISSPDIKTVAHVKDSGAWLGGAAGIKGWNGWNDFSKWDFLNRPVYKDWDGNLPDTLGFVTAVAKKKYLPHEEMKVYSVEMIVPGPGILTLDTAFYPPGGSWKVVLSPKAPGEKNSDEKPGWKGPYKWTVVK